jgi:hypothetical protein
LGASFRETPVSKSLGILLFSSDCFIQSLDYIIIASPFFPGIFTGKSGVAHVGGREYLD